ncbi:hypothetical protein CDD81_2928 [Ophiocordyceps australis]|uniref:non-specific serine/threonine protein kinase n=1 Tax=Ophiocordyceps australis TaxID=1399860 RepID=A0A2C5XCD0_9HYPO|nr:hypothetical protein CDD81_2928 [Ophiocordyceps australis]
MSSGSLQVRWPALSATKHRAIEDASAMQKAVTDDCIRAGKQPPPYSLSELIGKGSFGRVYKASSLKTGKLVAVKIIDIDESDTLNPKLADTYSDLLKEINALQLLADSGARNINHVIEALPVGQSMWMITEYCAGGSVATLMKPTAPGGLQEKWIIPIVREVAEAMRWVHGQGIIHRDLKCANVLVTETGEVQLCDFGVAGVIDTKFDKRSTFIGTPHWMAPELFDQQTSYGTEVDIWAFGALVFEIASGLPPNVTDGIDISRLGSHLRQQAPRLQGDQYSSGLTDLVAYCLQQDPAKRPSIEQLQRHVYIFKTEEAYPSSSLSHLVRAFKLWEAQGGDRRSLFSAAGAQALSGLSSTALSNDEWNFSTTAAFDQQLFDDADAQDVYDVYGLNVDFSFDQTPRPSKNAARRRPPPQLPSFKAPLEKVFDPNTISNYDDNSKAYYNRPFVFPPQASTSDLPLRDESAPAADVRESLIDLDASLHGSHLSQFVDMNTIRAAGPRASVEYNMADGSSHYVKAPLSDPADVNANRRTQDWKFPTMAPPASANPEMLTFPFHDDASTPAASRPPLKQHPTEPLHNPSGRPCSQPSVNSAQRSSIGSLIDLDMSFADSSDNRRPSTSHSDVGSVNGSEVGAANPFELERHASLYVMPHTNREPSIYVSDDSEYAHPVVQVSQEDIPPRAKQQPQQPVPNGARPYSLSEFADMDPEPMPSPQASTASAASTGAPSATWTEPTTIATGLEAPSSSIPGPISSTYSRDDSADPFYYVNLPPTPHAPTPAVMEGSASPEEVKNELQRMAYSLGEHLFHTKQYLEGMPIRGGSTAPSLYPFLARNAS